MPAPTKWECRKCGAILPTKAEFDEHCKEHKFICEFCGKECKNQRGLAVHTGHTHKASAVPLEVKCDKPIEIGKTTPAEMMMEELEGLLLPGAVITVTWTLKVAK